MLFSSLLAIAAIQGVTGIPTPLKSEIQARHESKFTVRDTTAFAAPAKLEKSEHIAKVKKIKSKAASSKALASRLATKSAKLVSVEEGAGYAVQVGLDGQKLDLIFDTGSSDLWVAKSGFTCLQPDENGNLQSAPDSDCVTKTFTGSFEDGAIANENFNITYGDEEFVIGTLGREDTTIAGVTVKGQEIALASEAYFNGDGVSGIAGFAFPTLTSAFTGTNPAADTNANNVHYNPFIFNAISQKLVNSSFSLALERGANGGSGQLALGGLPAVSNIGSFASTPLKKIELTPNPQEKTNFSYYTITPQGYSLSGNYETYYGNEEPYSASPSTRFNAIVDSGTTLLYYPAQIAEDVNALFDPPAVYIEEEGVFETACDAIAPTFGITIGGQTFNINSADLLLTGELGEDPETGLCVTGVQPSEAPYILGDVFLKNVVAVYDIGASEMRFATHDY